MYPDSLISNCLQHQKDNIRERLYGDNPNLESAITCLAFVEELWCQTDYAYKGRELCDQILREIWTQRDQLHPNAKVQNAHLLALAESVNAMRARFSKVETEGKHNEMRIIFGPSNLELAC